MQDLGHRLYRAMKDGDESTVAQILECATPDELGAAAEASIARPLHAAVLCERLDFLDAVLAAGAPVNAVETNPRTSVFMLAALEVAYWLDREDMASRLLHHGAEERFATCVFRRDLTAVRSGLKGAPSLVQSAFLRPTYTLLHVAADLGSAPLVAEFVKRGVNPNQPDADGHAPLRLACRNEPALEALDALLDAGADVNHASKTGITALTAAVRHADGLPTVKRLLERGADPDLAMRDGTTPLMKAASNRLAEAVRLLLDAGATRTMTNRKGQTALDMAVRRKADACVALLE
ncbi:MAG: ankyrin repeat domain-containing protein [Planctomycetota bacterium]